jgi:hypothetical protein
MMARWLFVVLSLTCMQVNASTTLKGWIAANVEPAERVLCQRELNGEYFFVARAGDDDKLRLGSRVDMSGYALQTFSVSVSWRLRDENNVSITPKIVPTPIRDEFLRVGGKAYAESVQYQTVNVGRPKRLRADVVIEKCPVWPCSKESSDAKRYTVEICGTAL